MAKWMDSNVPWGYLPPLLLWSRNRFTQVFAGCDHAMSHGRFRAHLKLITAARVKSAVMPF
jgi:hypothetical protein